MGNVSYFTVKVLMDACVAFEIKHCKTTAYHPQVNPTEQINRNFKFSRQHRDWDVCRNEIGFSFMSMVNRSTGYMPAFLNFVGKEHPMDRVLWTSSRACATKAGLSGYMAELHSRMDATLAHSNLAKARAGHEAQYNWSH